LPLRGLCSDWTSNLFCALHLGCARAFGRVEFNFLVLYRHDRGRALTLVSLWPNYSGVRVIVSRLVEAALLPQAKDERFV